LHTVIRAAGASDAAALARIYNHYIRETVITFEEVEIGPAEMGARVAKVDALSLPWLVAEHGGAIVGYAYAAKWRERSAYRYSVESTVYLDPQHTGRGIGTRLYQDLLTSLRPTPMHIVIGGVALPNAASIALHEKLGFTKVAHFEKVGFKFGRWIDVAYWQLALRTPADAPA
jgi:L-amino acid N-acyltransferase YncA